jgi:hypothetical protein
VFPRETKNRHTVGLTKHERQIPAEQDVGRKFQVSARHTGPPRCRFSLVPVGRERQTRWIPLAASIGQFQEARLVRIHKWGTRHSAAPIRDVGAAGRRESKSAPIPSFGKSAVVRVYDTADNMIEMHEYAGDQSSGPGNEGARFPVTGHSTRPVALGVGRCNAGALS